MTKDEIIDLMIADCGFKTKGTGEKVFQVFMDSIIEGLQKDGEVQLGFGKFKKITRSARIGRNPQTGESIEIPEKQVVKFIAAKTFKEEIQDPEEEINQ
jgi:DNA-binding protein HU-beta